jgi:hypothetical protein
VLTQIQEENPGAFYEASTSVPENTPCSQTGLTAVDLPHIDECLEELPAPLAAKFGSPAPSVFNGSVGNQGKYIFHFLILFFTCLPEV